MLCGIMASLRAETTSGSGATAITSVPCTITSPGTYYLASDLSVHADIPYAIRITASNVTLDFNNHTLAQLYTSDNGTLGVYISGNNVTVRNGTVTGFLTGVNLYADNASFEDLFVAATTWHGMDLNGSNILVRRCRVNNIGGETVPNLVPNAIGILLQNGSNGRVMDCDVNIVTSGQGAYSACLWLISVENALVTNNRVSSSIHGLTFAYGSGKYRDNLTSTDLYYPYDLFYSAMVDAGNNQ